MSVDQVFERQVTGRVAGKSSFPLYDGAALGMPEHWYPVIWGRDVTTKPQSILVCGQDILLMRDEDGAVRALSNRCAHRGLPLSMGRQEFPGTVTCRYHGWTYGLKDGCLLAALTDGPDSPIVGASNARLKTHRVREVNGLVWVYIGQRDDRELEDQVPGELLTEGALVMGRTIELEGDWRHAVEAGFDEGHAKYLHRRSLWKLFRYLPAWSAIEVEASEDGRWLTRKVVDRGFQEHYPDLGTWPPDKPFWKTNEGGANGKKRKIPPVISVAAPGILRIHWAEHAMGKFDFWEFWMPSEIGRYRYTQLISQNSRGLKRFRTWLLYNAAIRWIYHHAFHQADLDVIRRMQTPPEVLYRPDRSISAWRKLAESELQRIRQS